MAAGRSPKAFTHHHTRVGMKAATPLLTKINLGNLGNLGNFGNELAEARLQFLELHASGTQLLVRQLGQRCRDGIVLLVQVTRVG